MVNCSLSPEPAALLLNDAVWNSASLMNEVLLIAQKKVTVRAAGQSDVSRFGFEFGHHQQQVFLPRSSSV